MAQQNTEDTSPVKFTIDGIDYDVLKARQQANKGVDAYIRGLKKGNKHYNEFYNAYTDLFNAINSGDIRWENDRFIDRRGKAFNDKNRDKDYYGKMAYYIFNSMNDTSKYADSNESSKTEKKKWEGSKSISEVLRQHLNITNDNLSRFIDNDKWDIESKTRGTSERSSLIHSALGKLLDFDSLFTEYDYTPEQKAQAVKDIQTAMGALSDRTLDPGDLWKLEQVAPGYNWEGMFTQGESYSPQTVQGGTSSEQAAGTPTYSDIKRQLVDFASRYDTPSTYTYRSPYNVGSGNPTGVLNGQNTPIHQTTWNQYVTGLKNLSPEDRNIFMKLILQGNQTNFWNHQKIVSALGGTNGALTVNNPTLLRALIESIGDLDNGYIPGLDNVESNTGYVYDKTTGTVTETPFHKIGSKQKEIWNNFWAQQEDSDTPEHLMPYITALQQAITSQQQGVSYQKEGGILKFQQGSDFRTQPNPNKYLGKDITNTAEQAKNVGLWDGYYNIGQIFNDISLNKNNDLQSLATSLNTFLSDTKGFEKTWDIKDTSGKVLNRVNEQGFKSWNEAFDKTGLNDYFGRDEKLFDYFGPTTYNRQALIRYLQNNAIENDLYKMSFEDGQFKVSPKDSPESFKAGLDAPESKATLDLKTGLPKTPVTTETGNIPDEDPSEVIPGGEDPSKSSNLLGTITSALGEMAPDLIGAVRLPLSLHTNNKVARTIRPTLKPVLQDTYELYSPVTGAFSEMQLRNRQAADTRRLGSRIANSTSDASIGAAAQLDANRQSRDLEYQGFLADDREILRTRQEALKRQEDNTARRSQVANANRASINQTNREIAQLEATRLKSNWQSWDNFLAGIEGRTRQQMAYRQHLQDQANTQAMSESYANAIAQLNAKFSSLSDEQKLNNPAYIQALQELRQQYGYEVYNMSSNPWSYSNPYGSYNSRSYEDIIKAASLKKGGKLELSALELINKVIRDESST